MRVAYTLFSSLTITWFCWFHRHWRTGRGLHASVSRSAPAANAPSRKAQKRLFRSSGNSSFMMFSTTPPRMPSRRRLSSPMVSAAAERRARGRTGRIRSRTAPPWPDCRDCPQKPWQKRPQRGGDHPGGPQPEPARRRDKAEPGLRSPAPCEPAGTRQPAAPGLNWPPCPCSVSPCAHIKLRQAVVSRQAAGGRSAAAFVILVPASVAGVGTRSASLAATAPSRLPRRSNRLLPVSLDRCRGACFESRSRHPPRPTTGTVPP